MPLTYSGNALQNLGNVLAPLMAIALFIEDAVEVHALEHATGDSMIPDLRNDCAT